jgi:hypothetical protein
VVVVAAVAVVVAAVGMVVVWIPCALAGWLACALASFLPPSFLLLLLPPLIASPPATTTTTPAASTTLTMRSRATVSRHFDFSPTFAENMYHGSEPAPCLTARQPSFVVSGSRRSTTGWLSKPVCSHGHVLVNTNRVLAHTRMQARVLVFLGWALAAAKAACNAETCNEFSCSRCAYEECVDLCPHPCTCSRTLDACEFGGSLCKTPLPVVPTETPLPVVPTETPLPVVPTETPLPSPSPSPSTGPLPPIPSPSPTSPPPTPSALSTENAVTTAASSQADVTITSENAPQHSTTPFSALPTSLWPQTNMPGAARKPVGSGRRGRKATTTVAISISLAVVVLVGVVLAVVAARRTRRLATDPAAGTATETAVFPAAVSRPASRRASRSSLCRAPSAATVTASRARPPRLPASHASSAVVHDNVARSPTSAAIPYQQTSLYPAVRPLLYQEASEALAR